MRTLVLIALAACASPSGDDVVGPFTGDLHRYTIDAITVSRESVMTTELADDLDGDGAVENQIGVITQLLATTNDLTSDQADMITSGALASSIEIQANDLSDDPSASVRYVGADGTDGAETTVVGGRFVGGAFRSNRTATTHAPGRALVHLPVFTNSDPLELPFEGLEIDLAPDGRGGFDAIVRGGVRQELAREAAYAGLMRMFTTEPARHIVFMRNVDTNHDGRLSADEIDNSVIALLTTADIQLFDGARYAPNPLSTMHDSLSAGFAVHLAPCDAGRCSTGTPASPCRDRVRDGDETDVDCGGSCQSCATAASCVVPADCQSNACDAGHCRPPSCNDGVRDGFESDVDCGDVCAGCQLGRVCAAKTDCASGNCDNGVASLGHCLPAL